MHARKKGLTADALRRGAKAIKMIDLEEFGGVVYHKPLSARAVTEFYRSMPEDSDGSAEARTKRADEVLKMVAEVVCDESGAELFDSVEDIKELPYKAVSEIRDAVLGQAGIGDEGDDVLNWLGEQEESEAVAGLIAKRRDELENPTGPPAESPSPSDG